MYEEIKLLQGLGIWVFGEGLAGLDCVKMSCLKTDPITFLKEGHDVLEVSLESQNDVDAWNL